MTMRTLRTRLGLAVAALGLLAAPAVVLGPAVPASAAGATANHPDPVSVQVSGDRRCVIWSKLYLYNWPDNQAWDQLYAGQTFSVYEYRPSGWARGFAWGHINSDRSPYAPPYNDIWVREAGLGKHVNDGSTC